MADVLANQLRSVQTYQMAELAYLNNVLPILAKSNKKYREFDKLTAQLGDTVTFEKPPRFTGVNSLVASFQPIDQRFQPLVVSNQYSVSVASTDQQWTFNLREYMDRVGKGAILQIATQIEKNIASNFITNTYRFYGNGTTPINSYNQLAEAQALFTDYGAAPGPMMGFVPVTVEPQIVGSGLNQFATSRNNEIANSWEIGSFGNCSWYRSNLLPFHKAGTEGNAGSTLTVVSFTQNGPNGSIDTITFSGTLNDNDSNSVKQYDKFQFKDISGQPTLRYLTWIGQAVSENPVQFQATANATSSGGGNVQVSVYPYLQAGAFNDQNLNTQITVGSQVFVLPDHRAGLICAGDPLFVAMPQLPNMTPYPTANEIDRDTGATIRMYHGSRFGENIRGWIHDVIWGSTLVPEMSMAVIFPV